MLTQAEKMEHLEKTQGWKEEEFDVVLQFLRTILLRRKPCPPGTSLLNDRKLTDTALQTAHR